MSKITPITPVDDDDANVDRIVAAAPHPSTWAPEKLDELRRLTAPFYRAVHENDTAA